MWLLPGLSAQSIEDSNRIAAGYYSRGQWQEAADSFEKMIETYPQAEATNVGFFFLGECRLQLAQYDLAYRAYQTFIPRNPNHPFLARATFRMGESAYRMGLDDRAIRMLEIYARDYPDENMNEYALAYLGEIRLKREEPQLAQRVFEKALQVYPQSHLSNQCRFGLAKALGQQGAEDEALRFYQMLVDEPGNSLAGAAHLQIAKIHLTHDELSAAQGHLIAAIEKLGEPDFKSEARYWLARTYAAKENYERAFEILELASQENPPAKLAANIYFDGAIAATKLNNESTARDWLNLLLREYPNNALADDALRLNMKLAQKVGDADEFDKQVGQFAEQFPYSRLKPNVMESAGRDYYEQKRYAESVQIFENLLADDLHSDDTTAAVDRANWRYLQSLGQFGLFQFAAAEKTLQQIDFTAASDELRPLAHLALAAARFGQQKFANAIPHYETSLTNLGDGDRANRAQTELTICLAEAGLWPQAVESFEKLKQSHSDKKTVLNTAEYLAEKSSRQQQFTYAARWYAYLAEPCHDPEIVAKGLSGLGWTQMELGDTASAMVAFGKLINECADSSYTAAAAMARGKYLDEQDSPEQAAQMYDLVIRCFADSDFATIAQLRRAYSLHKTGKQKDLAEAQKMLIDYLAMPGEVAARDEALYQLAWVYSDLGMNESAFKTFEQVVAEQPDSKYWPDAALRVARQQLVRKEYDPSDKLTARLMEQESNLPAAVYERAIYLRGEIATAKKNWSDVSQYMHQLLEQSKDEILKNKAKYCLAEAKYQQQEYKNSAELFQELRDDSTGLKSELKPWVDLRYAQCLTQAKEWQQALAVAETAKKQWPEFEASYEFDFVRGRSLENAGKLADARAQYQAVIDSVSGGETETAAIAQWRIGETFFHEEKYADAVKAYYKVDSLFVYEDWRSAAIFQAGKCQEHLGQWKHAEKLYSSLIEQFPGNRYASDAQTRLDQIVRFAKGRNETQSR